MATQHKYQLNAKDQQLFSFGKKFFGKKLDQIRTKKNFVQILKEKGLMDYLDPKIINNDIDHLSRFMKPNENKPKIKNFVASHSTTNKRKPNVNEEFKALGFRSGIKANHFRNIKNPNKPHVVNNEKNYINNVMVKPKYNQIVQKNSNNQISTENLNKDIKSMPIIFFDEKFEHSNRSYATTLNNININNLASLNNIPPAFFDFDFLNHSKSVNELEIESKQMQEKMDYVKNFLGKENNMFKIRKPLRRGTSIEPRK